MDIFLKIMQLNPNSRLTALEVSGSEYAVLGSLFYNRSPVTYTRDTGAMPVVYVVQLYSSILANGVVAVCAASSLPYKALHAHMLCCAVLCHTYPSHDVTPLHSTPLQALAHPYVTAGPPPTPPSQLPMMQTLAPQQPSQQQSQQQPLGGPLGGVWTAEGGGGGAGTGHKKPRI